MRTGAGFRPRPTEEEETMSTYMVDREHVRYLVHVAIAAARRDKSPAFRWWFRGDWRELRVRDLERARAIGQMLWDENAASVRCRYPDCGLDSDMPGPMRETFVYDIHVPLAGATDWVQVLSACHCYRYQSCEHDGWEGSEALAFLEALLNRAEHFVPGYEDAVWGAPVPAHPLNPDNATGAPAAVETPEEVTT